MNKTKLFTGILIVLFDLCILIFAGLEINPEYFELILAIYVSCSMVLGLWLIKEGSGFWGDC